MSMWSRRAFLRSAGLLGSAAVAGLEADARLRVRAAVQTLADRDTEETATDERFWREVQLAFAVDRTVINLDTCRACSSPRVVFQAWERYLDFANQAPSYHLWSVLEPNVERVRAGLASEFGCDAEELTITRNASEALQIAQLGLDLRAGDEVVTTNQDHDRMLTAWEQRVEREGIRMARISFPTPASDDELVRRVEEQLTPRTKVLHFCHMTNLTGQIFPVRTLCRLARGRGIQTIVDGAQAVGQIPVWLPDLDCDYYGASLHKWLHGPLGTGFLYVRRSRIAALWPLQPAPARLRANIRKFEQIGTHPAASHNAAAEALAFHQALGSDRKAARLRYLKNRWAARLQGRPRIRLLTSLDQLGSLATFGIDGLDPTRMAAELWTRRRILVRPVRHAEYQGLRVSPNLYTTLEELDAFASSVEEITERGLQ